MSPLTLRILGPLDVTPGAVALETGLARVDATSLEGRVVVTELQGATPRILGVFISIAGCEPTQLADQIVDAAAGAIEAVG